MLGGIINTIPGQHSVPPNRGEPADNTSIWLLSELSESRICAHDISSSCFAPLQQCASTPQTDSPCQHLQGRTGCSQVTNGLVTKKRKCASLYLFLQVRGRATCTVLAELLRGSSLPMGEDGFRVKSIGRAA